MACIKQAARSGTMNPAFSWKWVAVAAILVGILIFLYQDLAGFVIAITMIIILGTVCRVKKLKIWKFLEVRF